MSMTALARVALLGSERLGDAPPPLAGPLAADFAALEIAEDPARSLLRQAALATLSERAARLPAKAPVAAMPECAPETQPELGGDAIMLLLEVLAREDDALSGECLDWLRQAGRRLPARMLPRMLAQFGNATQRARVLAVGGEAARWLCQLRPEWAAPGVGDGLDPRDWEHGSAESRVAWLRAERARDPASARSRLEAAWADEAPPQRAALLGSFETGLSQDDEPFLEDALGDKRKEVRRVAQGLLRRLPQSRLVQRAIAALDGRLRIDRGLLRRDRLEILLPESHTPAMARDGIEAKPPADAGVGERGWWLQELLARVPPAHWCRAFGIDAKTLLKLADRHDHATSLRYAWLRGGIEAGDRDWLEIGLGLGLASQYGEQAEALVTAIARRPDAEAMVLRHLAAHAEHDHDALLAALPGPWSPALSRAVVDWLRARWKHFASKGREYAMHTALKLASRALDPRMAIPEDGWHLADGAVPKALNEFFGVHSLRRRFLLALQSSAHPETS